MRFFVVLTVLWVALPFMAQAATVTPVPEGSADCHLRLEGPIEAGDLERIKANKSAFPQDWQGEISNHFMCVSGPGGNLAEALKIAEFLYAEGIGTRIEAGKSCLSACAVMFMMGTSYFYEGIGDGHSAHRAMHVTSRLGFHRPELKLAEGGQFDGAAVERSFDIALEATLQFVQLANRGSTIGNMVPSDLIENMFQHRGQDFYYIETIGQTARWDIDLDGFEPPKTLDPRAAYEACSNLGIWQKRYEPRGEEFYERAVTLVDAPNGTPIYQVAGAREGDAPHQCLLQMRHEYGSHSLYACGILGQENLLIADDDCGGKFEVSYSGPEQLVFSYDFDERALFPPATPLTEANAVARQIEARAAAHAAAVTPVGRMGRLRTECTALDGTVSITNVENFVNMRAQSGFSGRVVAEIPLGGAVFPADKEMYLSSDKQAGDQRCVDLCLAARKQALTGNTLAELDQCFDNNRFWYKVRLANGQTGYVSGKFLKY